MHIWATRAKKKVRCNWDACWIEAGDSMMRGYSPIKNSSFSIKKYWKPECYLAQCLHYLDTVPYNPIPGGGRPKLNLEKEERRERKTLLNKLYRLKRRTVEFEKVHLTWKADEQRAKMLVIFTRLEAIGGVPPSFR